MSRIKLHKSDFGTSSWISVDGKRVDNLQSVYYTEFEDTGEIHLSVVFDRQGIDVEQIPEEEDRDAMAREIERLKAENAKLGRKV